MHSNLCAGSVLLSLLAAAEGWLERWLKGFFKSLLQVQVQVHVYVPAILEKRGGEAV